MILVTGANGFVGNKLLNSLNGAIAAPSLRDAAKEDVKKIIEESNADVIIHTAAIADTGVCERNPEDSYRANVLLPLYLAQCCGDRKLICFSSDQVYNGCEEFGPYLEDMAKPASVYAKHKLEMEQRVLDIQPSAVMLRAEWMYDIYSNKGNYFLNLLNAEESVSYSSATYRGVTYLREVAENMEKVITLPGGVYNFGSEAAESIYEITRKFVSFMKKDIQVLDSPPGHNLWMNCEKARKYGVIFSETLDGLKRCADDYKNNFGAVTNITGFHK